MLTNFILGNSLVFVSCFLCFSLKLFPPFLPQRINMPSNEHAWQYDKSEKRPDAEKNHLGHDSPETGEDFS